MPLRGFWPGKIPNSKERRAILLIFSNGIGEMKNKDQQLFHFRDFSLSQANCAMRIGTDGVLLGAWTARCCQHQSGYILDVGCGCGLIGMMLATTWPYAQIAGIEIDPRAAMTAKRNAQNSSCHSRVRIFQGDILNPPTELTSRRYELIVSNPPYFNDSLKSPLHERNMARHQGEGFSLGDLFQCVKPLLSEGGRIALVSPSDRLEQLRISAVKTRLRLVRLCHVRTVEGKEPKRVLSLWQDTHTELQSEEIKIEELSIQSARGQYTPSYQALTENFYLPELFTRRYQ